MCQEYTPDTFLYAWKCVEDKSVINYYWSGPRESDQFYTNGLFKGTATFYGSNEGANVSFCSENSIRINHNIEHDEASDFILQWQRNILKKDPDARFMSYNPNCVFGAPDEVVRHTVCLNAAKLMNDLDNKLTFRQMVQDIVPMLEVEIVYGEDCRLDMLQELPVFKGCDAFIVQVPIASGGEGTFILSEDTKDDILSRLKSDEQYIVSAYRKDNISVNIHAVIFDNGVQIFPGSVQIIQRCENRLFYRGCDYKAYQDLPEDQIKSFEDYAIVLCQRISSMGYRGVIGIDAILTEGHIYFLEVNNRFQGSTVVLNKSLQENGFPCLQEMNLMAFERKHLPENVSCAINRMQIGYSMYTYLHDGDRVFQKHLLSALKRENRTADILYDGFIPEQETEKHAFAFAVIFNCSITSCLDYKFRVHPALMGPSEHECGKVAKRDWTYIKIALVNRGIVLSEAAKNYIYKCGGMREGTYFALDLYLQGFYVNTPLYVKFTQLSPFCVDYSTKSGMFLSFLGQAVCEVDFDTPVKLPESKLPVRKVAFLATDRIRLQNNAYCTFVEKGIGCKFCEANGIRNDFNEDDILKIIDYIFDNRRIIPFRHILIGGLSNDIGKEKDRIVSMCKRIRSYSNMPIYLMCIPPSDEDIQAYVEAGVTEFGFNMEVYDNDLAKFYMPGKAAFSRETYLRALRTAASFVGKNGAVRCAFVVGLEPAESLMRGIEEVCKTGAAPILSVFRPIPGTKLEDSLPPTDEYLEKVLYMAENICNKYGLELGPQCPACRNNTLTVVRTGEVEKLFSDQWSRKQHDSIQRGENE